MLKIKTQNIQIVLYYFFIFWLCIPVNSKFPMLFRHVQNGLTAVACVFAVFVFFYHKYYQRKQLFPLLVWFFWIIAATLINGTNISVTISSFVAPTLCCAILVVYVFDHDTENVVGVISWMFTILMIIQAITLVTHVFGTLYTQGKIVNVYFFGIRIQINKIVPFALFFGLLHYKYGKKKSPLSLIISTFCGLFFALKENVSNSIVCHAVILLVLIVTFIIRSEHMWRNLAFLVLGISIVSLFLYTGRNSIFQWFLSDLLGKQNTTLDGRTEIWEQALANIKGYHWIIGNGYASNYTFSLGASWESHATHNQYLETVFCSGLIGLGIYIWMCVQQFRVIRYCESRFAFRVFLAVFIAIIIIQITATVFEKPYYYVFYIASLYLPQIALAEKEPRKRIHIKFRNKA